MSSLSMMMISVSFKRVTPPPGAEQGIHCPAPHSHVRKGMNEAEYGNQIHAYNGTVSNSMFFKRLFSL